MDNASNLPKSDTPIMADGELIFAVRRADGTVTEHRVDLLMLKLTCEQCETAHRLTDAEGQVNPTPEFLLDLAGKLQAIGIERCTPTLAWQAWVAASEQMQMLKKNLSTTPS
jgi:hypothetical protein